MDRFYRILLIGLILYVVFAINQICGHLNSQTHEIFILGIYCMNCSLFIAIISDVLARIITSMKEPKLTIITCLAVLPQLIAFIILQILFENWIEVNIIQIVCIQLIVIQVVVIVSVFYFKFSK